ncbi:MGMT family protein [Vulgatibacter sp.]|uniref:MGMT family protein n=1 Tax=Vulgatibacter sp. TaxID=1971226 RepID=UPI0035636074
MPESFEETVAKAVRSIPAGVVLSYAEVARRAGRPRGARAVARALRNLHGVPWWRVARADRTLAPEVAGEQAVLLRAEGVRIEGRRIVGTRQPGGPPSRG